MKKASDTTREARYKAAGLCQRCGLNPTTKYRCDECQKRKDGGQQKWRSKIRIEALTHYSGGKPTCKCCREDIIQFLTIDHINNDGAKHRREIGQDDIYYWLKANGYPSGFQVLCMNCNWAKGVRGVCPHQTQGIQR